MLTRDVAEVFMTGQRHPIFKQGQHSPGGLSAREDSCTTNMERAHLFEKVRHLFSFFLFMVYLFETGEMT